MESKAGAAVGAALASIGIVQNAAQTNGGLTWQSDEITYPKGDGQRQRDGRAAVPGGPF